MTLSQRHRLRLVLFAMMLALTALTLLCRHELAPMAEQLVVTQVDNQASDAINQAIGEQIEDGEIAYDRMITVHKDQAGNITAIRTNMEEINRLKSTVLQRVDGKLEQMSWERLEVPLGSVLLPELFSGKGPDIPVRVLAVRTSDAVFRNEFSEAGINQTLHTVTIDIHVVVTVLTWTGTIDVAVDSAVVAAQTVIVGTVPTTYFGMEGTKNGPERTDTISDFDFGGRKP